MNTAFQSQPRMYGMSVLVLLIACVTIAASDTSSQVQEFPVPAGSHPHDVAPATDGGVWYAAQGSGELGHLDPSTGKIRRIKLGEKSRPHGVIVGPDGAPWITDGGLNAIVRVDPATERVTVFSLPPDRPGFGSAVGAAIPQAQRRRTAPPSTP